MATEQIEPGKAVCRLCKAQRPFDDFADIMTLRPGKRPVLCVDCYRQQKEATKNAD